MTNYAVRCRCGLYDLRVRRGDAGFEFKCPLAGCEAVPAVPGEGREMLELISAVDRDDLAGTLRALDAGANPDAEFYDQPFDIYEMPVLFLAVVRGQLKIVKALLDRDADPEAKYSYGREDDDSRQYTALGKAIEGGHREIVKALLEKGAKEVGYYPALWGIMEPRTAMDFAKETNQPAIVQLLAEMKARTEGTVVIPFSKAKLVLRVLGEAAFMALSACVLLFPEQEPSLFVRVVIPLFIFLLGLTLVLDVQRLFDSRPGLVVSPEGIEDNSSLIAAGKIPWHEVQGFSVRSEQLQRYLMIYVAHPEQYIERGNALRRLLIRMNLKFYGSPVSIPAGALKMKFDDLVGLIEQRYRVYKSA